MSLNPKKPNKKKKKTRATQAEMITRYDRLEELMAFAYRRPYILEAMKEEFGVSPKQTEKMITEVYATWDEERKTDVEEKRHRQERRLLATMRRVWKPSERARFEAIYARIVGTDTTKRETPPGGEGAGGPAIKLIFEDYRAPEPESAAKKKR